ncbi:MULTISPECIES: phage integrase central domain-containing protein [unclassified Sphingomonas]|uniref:phage integrase central domain-containing protein n=1 Tax=unclassified Sphingomonas TaxID=196159 RepID=UPI0039E14831
MRWQLGKAFPDLGALPIEATRPKAALAVLKKVEAVGALETAHRLRSVLSRVFRYAVATVRIKRDPAADLRGATQRPRRPTSQ